jgi:excisionase family DNA binding protein
VSAVLELLTLREVAGKLRCSARTVRRIIDAGELRAVRLGLSGKSDRVHPDDLERYMRQTALYRHFDASGRLLYLGISLNHLSRLSEHRADAHWFRSIARIDVEWFDTRSKAERAERKAIKSERPLHNICHAEKPDSLDELRALVAKMPCS